MLHRCGSRQSGRPDQGAPAQSVDQRRQQSMPDQQCRSRNTPALAGGAPLRGNRVMNLHGGRHSQRPSDRCFRMRPQSAPASPVQRNRLRVRRAEAALRVLPSLYRRARRSVFPQRAGRPRIARWRRSPDIDPGFLGRLRHVGDSVLAQYRCASVQ
ncbi:hypothetical protein D3C85_1423850 [compost metagenome]